MKRLNYANITATAALILAMGTGGAWANPVGTHDEALAEPEQGQVGQWSTTTAPLSVEVTALCAES